MSNTISSACLPKTYTYDVEGQKVSVVLQGNPFAYEPQTLYSLAARRNQKRGFLFVSKVLGKHIPVDPFVPLLAGINLGAHFIDSIHRVNHLDVQAVVQALKTKEHTQEVYERVMAKPPFVLPQETLFIGFAETATGLGHAVFSLFTNAHYLHTTREKIPLLPPVLDFNEVHSHAVNHLCYLEDSDLLKRSKTVVLIDDEITTGNTALNIIQAIHEKYAIKDYVLLSLLDWRTKENRENFRNLEELLKVKIQTLALLEGEIEVRGLSYHEQSPPNLAAHRENPGLPARVEEKFLNLSEEVPLFSVDAKGQKSFSPYLRLTGRFGLSSRADRNILPLAREIGEDLKRRRSGVKTLCLGTGEFMYFPMLISAFMGEGISYHAATRSPIYPFAKPDYGIQNAFSYPCPDDKDIPNFVYNIPLNYYDELYVFLEREVSAKKVQPMLRVFAQLGIPRLILVIASPRPGKRRANTCLAGIL